MWKKIKETLQEKKTLADILALYGHKSYRFIECRTYFYDENTDECQDIFAGACRYNNEKRQILALDGDTYQLSDEYVKWEENMDAKGNQILTVWDLLPMQN